MSLYYAKLNRSEFRSRPVGDLDQQEYARNHEQRSNQMPPEPKEADHPADHQTAQANPKADHGAHERTSQSNGTANYQHREKDRDHSDWEK